MNKIIVGKYGKGQCSSIQQAFDMAMNMKGHVDIQILNGIYDEKAHLNRDDVTIIGEDWVNTVITYDDYANKIHEDGNKYGTFRTATLRLEGDNIIMKNISVINRSGNGRDYGQAVALFAEGDRMQFYNCRLIGAQDTLYMGPKPECPANREHELPEEEIVVQPKRQYYKNCYICGDVDFIFGGATAYFNRCEIFSKYNITEDDEKYEGKVKGYVAAPCTYRDQKYGFIFRKCRFTGDCPENTVYLGRPWRIYAKIVLLECEIGKHIKAEGWHDWDKAVARETAYFGEYHCKYENVAKRQDWIRMLSTKEANEHTRKKVLWEYFCED